MEWPDEYQNFINRMNTPRVVIDNKACSTATLVKVDSARNHGILLDAVQVLTDLDLSINKAYISSDGRWFMDVFHVTDHHGNKLTDNSVIAFIEQSLNTAEHAPPESRVFIVGIGCRFTNKKHRERRKKTHELPNRIGTTFIALELTGTDRPGLLSEVFAVLSDHNLSVAEAKVWTHNGRIASIILLDESNVSRVQINSVESCLRNLLKRDSDPRGGTINVSTISLAMADRRMHQMMSADRDYERVLSSTSACSSSEVTVQNWVERGYTIVSIQCRDRTKLLFDIVCTLTDMNYVVFHGTIDTTGDRAMLEFYVRRSDGTPIKSEAERKLVVQCLHATIERRASKGLRLELCSVDRRGLLADLTRTFRENGLSITGAEISTNNRAAINVFYVTDATGHPADPKTIDAVIERVGAEFIKVARIHPADPNRKASHDHSGGGGAALNYLGSIVKKNLYHLGLIRS